MRSKDVVELYRQLEAIGVAIWIDGGWAVDAVLGRQTRHNNDLDIAIEASDLPALRGVLERQGYRDFPTEDSSSWNFVLADGSGR
jgi:lincosamide nucleotidyltransferase A/C/D/E